MSSKARGLADLGNAYDDGALSNRNLIINGAMQVAQRGTSETGVTTSGYYTCDRFNFLNASLGTHTITQEADGPSGFANSLKVETTTADASPAAGDALAFRTRLEGQDLQQIAKGTSDAKQLTLSFWVKSNVTGTYQVNLRDSDNSRLVGATYTISASGTWEKVEITFPADTTGSLANDNTTGLAVQWWLDSGSSFTSGAVPTSWEAQTSADRNAGSNVNLGDTIGNYWQITGVQLELGDTATPFEHRSYGEELELCQRYYQEWGYRRLSYHAGAATYYRVPCIISPIMRAAPTATDAVTSSLNLNAAVFGNGLGLEDRRDDSFSLVTRADGAGLVNVVFSLELDAEL